MKSKMKKHLSAPGLLKSVRYRFEKVWDPLEGKTAFSLSDCLMSGLAIFGLKYPSLLQFDKGREEERVAHNLKALYGVGKTPSDTYLRERLDEVEPLGLRRTLKSVFSRLQRGKFLEGFVYHQNAYLVPLDGTGCFSSNEIHCTSCCTKKHRDGRVTYHHDVLSAVLVHPDERVVFPLGVEPIIQQDGVTKNDCESNAAKRLIQKLRTDHPHLLMILLGDALYANGPSIKEFKAQAYHYILSITSEGHRDIYEYVRASQHTHECRLNGITYRYRWVNRIPINDSHPDCFVNAMEVEEINKKGKVQRFGKITDFPIHKGNVHHLMKGGRARWKIENETLNTLKNQGYHFEHNFGHGKKHLHTVFTYLMFLAFLIDQIQAYACDFFKRALDKAERKLYFWEKVRQLFHCFLISSWEDLYTAIADRYKVIALPLDSP